MADDRKGTINAASDGGVSGEHAAAETFKFLVGPTTTDQFNTARLRLIPIACWRVDDVRFAFDSSFVNADPTDPDNPNDIRAELKHLVDLIKAHPGSPLSVFGHADPVGSDDYNKQLSGRRAKVIYGLLISNTDPGSAVKLWQDVSQAEAWGANQRQAMQAYTGLPSGTPDSTLFRSYLQKLCPPDLKLTKKEFLAQGADSAGKGDFQGCSEFNPLLIFSQQKQAKFDQAKQHSDKTTLADRNAQNAPNRRVMVLMFRKGSRIDPNKWPCPCATEGVAGCKKRFWFDGEKRRSAHLPDIDRRYNDANNTFACRFYQRLVGGSPCEALTDQSCWANDYEKEISQPSYGRYFRKYKADGSQYSTLPPKFSGKIYAPVKTGSKITVEVRFKQEALASVTAADVDAAKTKLETGVKANWNGKFALEADDPLCGKKAFAIEYKVKWVSSRENYVIKIHNTYPREGVTGSVMDVSKTTSDWVYAHEFGHCIGLPDEYSYVSGSTETVKYIKPDGSLDVAISAPFDGKSKTAPDATIMAAYDNTTVLPRHGWSVAIEVQELLTAKLGRTIKCSIR